MSTPSGLFATQDINLVADVPHDFVVPISMLVAGASGTVTSNSIHVVSLSGDEFTVYGLNQRSQSSDAFLVLPTDVLGTSYVHADWHALFESQLLVVATQAGTTVTVQRTFAPELNFNLNAGQAVYITRPGDQYPGLSGSNVTSNFPVALFGGNRCTNVPQGVFACDHIQEQIPPEVTLSNEWVTSPLATRLAGDVFRFISTVDGTQLFRNGAPAGVYNRGQVVDFDIGSGTAEHITASQPALLVQYCKGQGADGVVSDPFMMMVTPVSQYPNRAVVVNAPFGGFSSHFINLVAETAITGAVTVDGGAVGGWTAVGVSGYSYTQVAVSAGTHTVQAPPAKGVSVNVYGIGSFDSYGYPGGARYAPLQGCTPTPTVPGDGLDNDCDGRIDEELRNGIDDDGDGLIDEDLAVQLCDDADCDDGDGCTRDYCNDQDQCVNEVDLSLVGDSCCPKRGECSECEEDWQCITGACTKANPSDAIGQCARVDGRPCDPCPGNYGYDWEGDCRTSCVYCRHCGPGYYCTQGGCVARRAAGSPCEIDAQCQSDVCVSGECAAL